TQPFSFIRTLTVGFGIAPNLLTLLLEETQERKALAGLGYVTLYRRWGLSPRPENIGCPVWAALRELCRVAPARASAFGMGNQHVPMLEIEPRRLRIPGNRECQKLTKCKHANSDSGLF